LAENPGGNARKSLLNIGRPNCANRALVLEQRDILAMRRDTRFALAAPGLSGSANEAHYREQPCLPCG
jgi:hypothetical protein